MSDPLMKWRKFPEDECDCCNDGSDSEGEEPSEGVSESESEGEDPDEEVNDSDLDSISEGKHVKEK